MPTLARALVAASSLFLLALPVAAQDDAQEADFRDAYSASYGADIAEMFASRFGPAPPEFAGYESGPELTFERRVASFGGALAEDARYRTLGAFEAALRELRPSKVIDGDYRIVKKPQSVQPSKGVCQITSSFKKDGETLFVGGTAFFIAPRVLVTSAHLVYSSELGGGAVQVEVTPARSNHVKPFGSQEALKWYYPTGFRADETNGDFDFAWLILPDRTLYRRVKFFFDTKSLPDRQLASKNLVSLGYSITDLSVDKYRMLRDSEQQNQQIFEMRFVHYHDAGPGAAGMPLFYKVGNRYKAVGVHRGDAQGAANQAVRMVNGYIEQTNALKQQFR